MWTKAERVGGSEPVFTSEEDAAHFEIYNATERGEDTDSEAIAAILKGKSPKDRKIILKKLLADEKSKEKKERTGIDPDEELGRASSFFSRDAMLRVRAAPSSASWNT